MHDGAWNRLLLWPNGEILSAQVGVMLSDDELRKEPYGIILLAGIIGIAALIALAVVLCSVHR